MLAAGELLLGEEVAAVDAVVEDDLLGTLALDLDAEGDVLAGRDLRVARRDGREPRIGRRGDVGEEGAVGPSRGSAWG